MTPLDKVKNQLLAKVKELHLPDESSKSTAGVATKISQLDFVGNDEDKIPKKKKKAIAAAIGSDKEEEEENEEE